MNGQLGPHQGAKPPIRPDWLTTVVRELQLLAGAILPSATDPDAARNTMLARITAPESQLESYLLCGLLSEAELHLGAGVHRPEVPPVSRNPVQQIATLLTKRLNEHWTLERLAHTVGSNRSRLQIEFKREFATSIHQYLVRQRIEEAKRRLAADATAKVEAIAWSVGFQSKKAFYDAFRRETGLTPGTFRANASPE